MEDAQIKDRTEKEETVARKEARRLAIEKSEAEQKAAEKPKTPVQLVAEDLANLAASLQIRPEDREKFAEIIKRLDELSPEQQPVDDGQPSQP